MVSHAANWTLQLKQWNRCTPMIDIVYEHPPYPISTCFFAGQARLAAKVVGHEFFVSKADAKHNDGLKLVVRFAL